MCADVKWNLLHAEKGESFLTFFSLRVRKVFPKYKRAHFTNNTVNIAFARGGAHLPIAHALRLLSTQELRFWLTKLKLRKSKQNLT